jgi:hypothetical protein
MISLDHSLNELVDKLKRDYDLQEQRALNILPIDEVYASKNEHSEVPEEERKMERILEAHRKLQSIPKYRLSYHQEYAFRCMLAATLPNILGVHYDRLAPKYLQILRISDTTPYLILEWTRRFGKSYVEGYYNGVIAFCIYGIIINIFSMTRPNSDRVTKVSQKFILALKDIYNEPMEVQYNYNFGLKLIRHGLPKSEINSMQGKNADIGLIRFCSMFFCFNFDYRDDESNYPTPNHTEICIRISNHCIRYIRGTEPLNLVYLSFDL